MQLNFVTPELVKEMNKNNKIVAVWIDKKAPKDINNENEHFIKKCYDMGV